MAVWHVDFFFFFFYMHVLPLFQLRLIQDVLLYVVYSFLLTNHLDYYLKQPTLGIMPLFLFPGKNKNKHNEDVLRTVQDSRRWKRKRSRTQKREKDREHKHTPRTTKEERLTRSNWFSTFLTTSLFSLQMTGFTRISALYSKPAFSQSLPCYSLSVTSTYYLWPTHLQAEIISSPCITPERCKKSVRSWYQLTWYWHTSQLPGGTWRSFPFSTESWSAGWEWTESAGRGKHRETTRQIQEQVVECRLGDAWSENEKQGRQLHREGTHLWREVQFKSTEQGEKNWKVREG